MADQHLRVDISEFRLDLHGTSISSALQVVRMRIEECYRYGIRVLKVIYGTPDDYEHSISKAVHALVSCNELVATEMLPSYVFSADPPAKVEGALRVHLRNNPSAKPIDEGMTFQPFTPKYETDKSRLLRCRTPYTPLRRTYSFEWAARAIGHQCTPQHLIEVAKQKRIEREVPSPGFLTWEGVCQAAQAYSEFKKTFRSQSARRIRIEKGPTRLTTQDVYDPSTCIQTPKVVLAEARQLAFESKYEAAELALTSIISGTDIDPDIMESAFYELGRVYVALNKEQAETILLRALTLAEARLGRGPHLFSMLSTLGEYYISVGDYDALFKIGDKYADDTTTELTPAQHIDSLLTLALVECQAGLHKSSGDNLRRLSYIKGATKVTPVFDAHRFDLLGRNYTSLGDFTTANIAFECALRHCRAEPRSCEHLIPRVLLHQGVMMRRSGRYSHALQVYDEATKQLRTLNESKSIVFADTMSSMGVVYRHTSDFARSETCFAEAREIYTSHGHTETPEYANLLVNIAFLRISQKQCDAAKELLQHARDLYLMKSSADADALIRIQMCEGYMFRISGEMELAQITLEAARAMAREKLGIESFMYAKVTAELGEIHLNRAQTSTGLRLYSEALRIWESKGGYELIERIQAKLRMQEFGSLQ